LEEKEFSAKDKIENVLYNDILVPVYNFLVDHEAIRKIRPVVEKALGGTSYWFFKHVEIGEIWRWNPETGYVGVAIGMPDGTDPRFTIQLMRQFEEHALSEKGVTKVKTNIWPGGGYMRVEFTREAAKSFIPYMVKEKLIQLATNFAGFRVSVWGYGMGFSSGFGSGTISNYRLELKGYNYQELERIARKIKNLLTKHRRVRNVNINASGSYFDPEPTEEIVLEVKRQELGRYGMRVDQFLNTVRHYLQQENWFQKITIGEDEFIFNIKEKNSNQFSIDDLKNTILTLSDGSKIRIRDVADIITRKVEPKILRENQEYIRYISFDFIGPSKYGKRYVENFLKSTVLPPGYSLKQKKLFFSAEKKDVKNILLVILLSVLLVYMVTAALFESLKQPFIVLFAIPMALTGVFLAFFLTETNFDQSAMIGVILLAGIVVNNSILLIYHVDELGQKWSVNDSIVVGTLHRVRPILMTTLTTVLGMLPLILLSHGISQSSDLWSTLALSSIGGLITSTAFVLLAMPAILSLFYREKIQSP
jgi:HAE1 family hydrophobic/amphiphilic exporter-1